MIKYTIHFEKSAIKFLKKQDRITAKRLLQSINQLPNGTDIVKLQGYSDMHRMRVGNIRIIYSIKEELRIINIENIDNRGQVYKRY